MKSEFQIAYEADIKKIVDNASVLSLMVCAEWHGHTFGLPGCGGLGFTIREIEKAELAAKAFKGCLNEKPRVVNLQDIYNIIGQLPYKDVIVLCQVSGLNLEYYNTPRKQIIGLMYRLGVNSSVGSQ